MNSSILKVNKFFCIIDLKYRKKVHQMIQKITTLLLLLSAVLLAQVDLNPYHSKILSVKKDVVTLQNNPNIAVGATGIILHHFTKEHSAIIASVEVIQKDTDTMTLQLLPFQAIAQKALPNYSIKPQKGDEVILNFLYSRAMAIVPDAKTYQTVIKSYDAFTWVHPDIFAASLAKSYTPTPTKEAFQEMCIANNIGLLLFDVEGEGRFVDCRSFKTITTITLPQAETTQTPFYNRIEAIKGRVFGFFGGKGIKDYTHYYKRLLGIEK